MPENTIYYPRYLKLSALLAKKSYFLLGPRQVGKSSLIQKQLPEATYISLLDTDTYRSLSAQPSRIRDRIHAGGKLVVIDEIQKLPILLDEVHILIEQGYRFLLTGSSARKLRRSGVNLLGGRARTTALHPLVSQELKEDFNLEKAMNIGTLPSIYLSDEPLLDLRAYTGSYLKEEIAAEALVRNLPAFSRFLEVAALCNASVVNYSKISNESDVSLSTVQNYFDVLKDTLLLHELPAWRVGKKRRPARKSKMYFFDVGVARSLQGRDTLTQNTSEFGDALETYLFHELKAYTDYANLSELQYWRVRNTCEVDFILNHEVAVEVKATKQARKRDLKGLLALQEEKQLKALYLVCLDETPQQIEGVRVIHVNQFLRGLWDGEVT